MENLIVIKPYQLKQLMLQTLKEFKELQPIIPITSRPKKYLTRKDVCEMLNVSLSTLDNYVKKGRIKSHTIGNPTANHV